MTHGGFLVRVGDRPPIVGTMRSGDGYETFLARMEGELGYNLAPGTVTTWLEALTEHLSLWLGDERVEYAQLAFGEWDQDALQQGLRGISALNNVSVFVVAEHVVVLAELSRDPDYRLSLRLDSSHMAQRTSISRLIVTPRQKKFPHPVELTIDVEYDGIPGTVQIPPKEDRESQHPAVSELVPLLRDDHLQNVGSMRTWPATGQDDASPS